MLDPASLAAGPDGPMLMLIALVLDAYIGDPPLIFRLLPHPLAIMRRVAEGLERRLDKARRNETTRRVRGVLAALFLLATGALLGWLIDALLARLPYGWIVEMLVVMTLVMQRGIYKGVDGVGEALKEGGIEAGRKAYGAITKRGPGSLDAHGLARRAIESGAEGFADAVVGPTFWYLLAGLPGLIGYWAVKTLDNAIGTKAPSTRAFGFGVGRCATSLSLIPAALAGLLLAVAAAFVPTARPWTALRVMLRDGPKHRSIVAGWADAAVAGGLGLALAGPRRYGEVVIRDPWLGDGRARATPLDIRRAVYVVAVGCLINAGLVAGLAAARATL